MRKLFRNNSIQRFVILFILFFTIIPSILGTIYAYYFTTNVAKNNYASNYMQAIFLEIEDNITLIANQLNNFTLNLVGYRKFSSIIDNNRLTAEQKNQSLTALFDDIISDKSIISALDVITPDGQVYRYGSKNFSSVALDKKFLDSLTRTTLTFGSDCIKNNDTYYCYIGKRVYNYNSSYELCSVVFYLNESVLNSVYNTTISDEGTFFLSVDQKIISHPDKRFLGSVLYLPGELMDNINNIGANNTNYLFSTYPIKNKSLANKMQITCVISNKILFATLNKIVRYILLSLLVVSCLSIFLALLFSKKLVAKVIKLNKSMSDFSKDYRAEVALQPSNEIALLEISFNQMASEIQQLIRQIAKEQENQRIAEIKLLQSQINPHFIYNALDAISWKAKCNKQYEIDNMLIALASFFRYGLHKGENIIKIKDEIEHAKSYIAIEQFRFPGLFDVQFEISGDILEYSTVKIILQPVIENCIKHGFKNIRHKGLIIIRGFLTENKDIIFEIEDNGKGQELPPTGTLPLSSDRLGGYGLYNVNERLKIEYGEGYGITFKSQPQKGTLVTLRIKSR